MHQPSLRDLAAVGMIALAMPSAAAAAPRAAAVLPIEQGFVDARGMTFVDQPELFRRAVDDFVHPPPPASGAVGEKGSVDSVVQFLLTAAATDAEFQ